MTRSELTAAARFQQSMTVLQRDPTRRSPYGLQAQAGYLGARDPQTGDRTFTAADGVTSPARDLRATAQPVNHDVALIEVQGGKNYVR